MSTTYAKRVVVFTVAAAAVLLSGCVAPTPTQPSAAERTFAEIDLDRMRTQCIQVALESVPLEEQVRSVLMLHIFGLDRAEMESVLAETRPGGLIAMRDNIAASPEQTAAVFNGLSAPFRGKQLPLLLAVDQEGGDVSRIPQDTFLAGQQLQGQSPEAVQQAFASRATLIRDSGFNVNFGIVADVTDNPRSFIYPRVLGVTPEAAAVGVEAAVRGEQGTVMSTLKHFPGHGATDLDSHSSLPTVTFDLATWQAQEAPPFMAGIGAGAELVMMGHLVFSGVDALPASQSSIWVNILREDLGFEGLIITDDMRMLEDSGVAEYADANANAIRALSSGASMLLYVGPSAPSELIPFVDGIVSAVLAAVERGEIPQETISDAAARVFETRQNLVDADPRSWCRLFAGQYSIPESP